MTELNSNIIDRKGSLDSIYSKSLIETETNPIKEIYDENFTEIRSIVIFKSVFELFATFLFILIIILCQKDISKFILGMWIILIVFGNFSGAHLNPAISLGFYINKGKYSSGLFKFVMYVLAQFIGCYLGILTSFLMKGKIDYLSIPDTNILQVLFSEMFFTGTLFFVIIVVSFPQTTPSSKGFVNALFVVCWFLVIVNAGALISGAAFNPAVLFSMNSIAYFVGMENAKRDFSKLISMIIAQFTGVIIFAFIYKNIVLNFHKHDEENIDAVSGKESSGKGPEKKIMKNQRFSHDVKNELYFNNKELENRY